MEDHLGSVAEDAAGAAAGLLGRTRFVLCRPRNPQNLGAAARALQSAGIGSWDLVAPQTLDFDAARPLAMHAGELLYRPRVLGSLADALAGCALSIGTSGKPPPGRRVLPPREAAALLAASPGPVAVVFGDERNGLLAEELDAVDHVSAIPSAPEQPSWNLAQAIAVYAYEVRLSALAARAARGPEVGVGPRGAQTQRLPANPAELAAVDRALAAALSRAGRAAARRALARPLLRASLTRREAILWVAILRQLERAMPAREK